MRGIRDKLSDLDAHGTAVANVRFANLEGDLRELKDSYRRQEESKGADRRVMLGALLAAATALVMAVIGVLIQIVTRHP